MSDDNLMSSELLPIENYVPHRGAMLLLDRLLASDDETAVAEVTVPRDGLFLHDAGMPSWVGMEYMAQTVAAWAGWRARQKGREVQIGFLLGSRKYETAQAFFAPGSRLTVSVRCELLGDNGLGMFDCRIDAEGGKAIATARISVFEPGDGSAYISPTPAVGP
ncbi:hotdog family protein [Acidovorax sp.]|uniref:hotdog family protein n=1 Tax=Acidovorax sp. TaxID=1872122 RepID=UPI0026180A89|nr:hotdog family protein [Acidovorax sp.]